MSSIIFDVYGTFGEEVLFDLLALREVRIELIEDNDSDVGDSNLLAILRARGFVWRPRMLRDGVVVESGWSTW